jgi:hypothetical protein
MAQISTLRNTRTCFTPVIVVLPTRRLGLHPPPAASPQALLPLLQADERAAVVALRELGEYRYLPASALTVRGFLAGLQPSMVILMANETIEVRGAEANRPLR